MKNVIRSLHQIRPSPIEEGDQIDDHYTSVAFIGSGEFVVIFSNLFGFCGHQSSHSLFKDVVELER